MRLKIALASLFLNDILASQINNSNRKSFKKLKMEGYEMHLYTLNQNEIIETVGHSDLNGCPVIEGYRTIRIESLKDRVRFATIKLIKKIEIHGIYTIFDDIEVIEMNGKVSNINIPILLENLGLVMKLRISDNNLDLKKLNVLFHEKKYEVAVRCFNMLREEYYEMIMDDLIKDLVG